MLHTNPHSDFAPFLAEDTKLVFLRERAGSSIVRQSCRCGNVLVRTPVSSPAYPVLDIIEAPLPYLSRSESVTSAI